MQALRQLLGWDWGRPNKCDETKKKKLAGMATPNWRVTKRAVGHPPPAGSLSYTAGLGQGGGRQAFPAPPGPLPPPAGQPSRSNGWGGGVAPHG